MARAVKSAFILFAATILSKSLGFVRDLAIAYVYGANAVSDSYLMALNIISIAFMGLFCVAIQSSFMPIYTSIDKNEGKAKALDFAGNVINIIMLASVVVIVLGWIFTEPLVKLFAMGYTGERLRLTIEMTRIVLFAVGIVSVTYILKAYLEIHNFFLITGLMALPYNLAIVISVLLSSKFGVGMLGYGTLFAFFAQMLFLAPFAMKKGFKYRPKLNINDKNLRHMAFAIAPILIGASANQVNSLVDKNLASTLNVGAMSALNYGFKLNVFVTGLFVASITSVMYPLFSKLGANKNITKLKECLSTTINTVTLVTVPISFGAFVLANPIIRVLFERGKFNASATRMTAEVLMCYALGMLASGIRDVVVIVYYSLQDTKTPMKNSILCVAFNIGFNLLLINHLKAPGLALASSISAILAVLFLMYNLRKKIGQLGAKSMVITIFKTSIAAALMSAVVLFVFNRLGYMPEAASLGISVLAGAVVYACAVFLLKVDSLDYFLNIVRSKLRGNN
ncbi:MAG: murein biosynthesis integral membrane protein MurJ [Clostridioides sp.]|nr:murein biosynthesis integral membrane protein MurJ [Clostridioides sp.]